MSDERFAKGCRLLVEGMYAPAAIIFAELLDAHGDHPGVRHNRALALECQKEFAEAAREYAAVASAFPDYAPAYLGLANCAFYTGDADNAEATLRTAREVDPEDTRAAILLSEILLLKGQHTEGIRHHLDALTLIDEGEWTRTDNHVMCYGDFGVGGPQYYSFWERSLLQRDAFPPIPVIPRPAFSVLLVLVAHSGNAEECAARLQAAAETWGRKDVVLVTVDDIAHRILKEHEPDLALWGMGHQANELPAVALHVAAALMRQGHGVVLPGASPVTTDLIRWAASKFCDIDAAVTPTGDLCARSPATLDPCRVPPLLFRGQDPAPDIFATLFT
jgi:tetratricopeptide (TPR) repeat protein